MSGFQILIQLLDKMAVLEANQATTKKYDSALN